MEDPTTDLDDLLGRTGKNIKATVIDRLGANPTVQTFITLMTASMETANRLSDCFGKVFPAETPLACQAGCDICCTRTEVQTQPAFAIYTLYHAKATADGKPYRNALQRLQKHSVDCPFLENRACSIYPARPIVCRLYHSYDLAHCLKRESLKNPTLATSGLIAVAKGLEDGFKALSLDCEDISLHEALKLLTSEEGVAERWLKGQEVFAPCRI